MLQAQGVQLASTSSPWPAAAPKLLNRVAVCRAAADNNAPPSPATSSGNAGSRKPARAVPKLPKKGYFSIADTNVEVYSKAGEKFDPTKRGGRYQPEFIWNTNWQEQLEREESLKRQADREGETKAEEGFLSMSRLSALDDMSVDLSAQLRVRKDKQEQQQAASKGSNPGGSSSAGANVFTRKEVGKLQRVARASDRGVAFAPPPSAAEAAAEAERVAEEERVKYEKLKTDFQIWTLAFTALGYGAAYTGYSQDIAASYLVGAVGGLVYLRLLGKGVDGIAGQGLVGGVSSIVGQQRLLIPVILALGYNRWNLLAAESTGVTLQLLPMLVGFFTYKFAVIARQAKDVLDAAVGKLEGTK